MACTPIQAFFLTTQSVLLSTPPPPLSSGAPNFSHSDMCSLERSRITQSHPATTWPRHAAHSWFQYRCQQRTWQRAERGENKFLLCNPRTTKHVLNEKKDKLPPFETVTSLYVLTWNYLTVHESRLRVWNSELVNPDVWLTEQHQRSCVTCHIQNRCNSWALGVHEMCQGGLQSMTGWIVFLFQRLNNVPCLGAN